MRPIGLVANSEFIFIEYQLVHVDISPQVSTCDVRRRKRQRHRTHSIARARLLFFVDRFSASGHPRRSRISLFLDESAVAAASAMSFNAFTLFDGTLVLFSQQKIIISVECERVRQATITGVNGYKRLLKVAASVTASYSSFNNIVVSY